MVISEDNPKHLIPSDDCLLDNIWNALRREATIHPLELSRLLIKVQNGDVYLNGYIKEDNLQLIESIVLSTSGVEAVNIRLVVDRDLIIEVAQALAIDTRTQSYSLLVDAFHGWIHIGGEVPTREMQQVVESIAKGVPGVRGVTILPGVTGEGPIKPHRPAQPRIGAVVYGKAGENGIVTQVVIQPDIRMVTHIIVRSKEFMNGKLIIHDSVIPLEASDLVKDESIILQRHEPSLTAFPAFDPDEFPSAPSTWQAPYPYTSGEVRWLHGENLDASKQLSQSTTNPGAQVKGSQEKKLHKQDFGQDQIDEPR